MAKPVLTREPFLGGYSREFERARLAEATNLSLVCVAEPQGGRDDLNLALRGKLGLSLPEPGSSSVSEDGKYRIIWLARDQSLLLFEAEEGPASQRISAELRGAAHVGEQSDNWVALRLSGEASEEALERICPVDISIGAFPVGSVARTAMEHMGAIAVRRIERWISAAFVELVR